MTRSAISLLSLTYIVKKHSRDIKLLTVLLRLNNIHYSGYTLPVTQDSQYIVKV